MPWAARTLLGGWAPSPMAIGATQWFHAHRFGLGRLHGSPCAAVEPARPTHVSAGSNNRTPVVGWGGGHSPRLGRWAGASQLICLTETRPTAATPSPSQGTYWHSSGATLMSAVTLGLEPAVRRWTCGSSWQAAQGWVLRPLCAGGSRKQRQSKETGGKCSRRSTPVWWAWLDLNQRPHPYQVSRAQRCADRRFPRSSLSVRGEGMRSCTPFRREQPSVRPVWIIIVQRSAFRLQQPQARSGVSQGRARLGSPVLTPARPASVASARLLGRHLRDPPAPDVQSPDAKRR
jgi:hypothetical protein